MANRVTAVPVVLLLLLLLAAAAAAARPAREKNPAAEAAKAKQDEWKNILKLEGSFSTRNGKYYTLAERMKSRATGDRKVAQHPLLYNQPRRYHQAPPFFIDETLHGEGLDQTRLFIRGDNLYLGCFTNARGQVFCFNDDQYNSYKIPNSFTLPFGPGYGDLVGDGQGGEAAWRNLEGLDLSKAAVNRAIKVVGSYNRGKTTDAEIQELKGALTMLLVFYCEAARFPYIRQLVDRAYSIGDEVKLDFRGAQLVVQWKRISCAILIWNMDKKRWDSREANELCIPLPRGPGIATVEEALAEVWPILHARGCSVEDYERFL